VPAYYELMADVGRFMAQPSVRVLVAVSAHEELVGGVGYFGAMTEHARRPRPLRATRARP
jgi:hypothetical protein